METSALSKASQRTNLPIWLNVTFTKTSTVKVYNKSELKKEQKKKLILILKLLYLTAVSLNNNAFHLKKFHVVLYLLKDILRLTKWYIVFFIHALGFVLPLPDTDSVHETKPWKPH